jgi:queuine tRNA-ribosyltransferase
VLNSDIVMQFDECTPYETRRPTTHDEAAVDAHVAALGEALARRIRPARNPNALFGIVQGGMFEDLRDESLAGLSELGFTATRSAACRSASRRKT